MNKRGRKLYNALLIAIRIFEWTYLLYIILFISTLSEKNNFNLFTVNDTLNFIANDICYVLQLILIVIFQVAYKFRCKEVNIYMIINIIFIIPEYIYLFLKYIPGFEMSGSFG